MILKPQDIVVLLKLVVIGSSRWSYNSLANELAMSPAEVHAGIKRCIAAKLFDQHRKVPIKSALHEFLAHGIKYAFPPDRGTLVRGIPTGFAAPPLNQRIAQSSDDPPVWPDPEGKVKGYSFPPLYKSVPKAVADDQALYEMLALVDAIRDDRARERAMAVEELAGRLGVVL